MEQLSATDSGLLFYCDLESVVDGLKDFRRPTTNAGGLLSDDDDDAEWGASDDAAAASGKCYVSYDKARSSVRMAHAALKAKNKIVETLAQEGSTMREELLRERSLRRAAEASDEDSGFLRQQMETILKEKARLAQDNARLKRETQTLVKELDILNVQIESASIPSKKLKEAERMLRDERQARQDLETRVAALEETVAAQKQENRRLLNRVDEERENYRQQEHELMRYASKLNMFAASPETHDTKARPKKQGLALVTQSPKVIRGAGAKTKRIMAANTELQEISMQALAPMTPENF